MSKQKSCESIGEILVGIAKDGDIHESICKNYIRRHKVEREQIGDNINVDDDENGQAAEPAKPGKGEPLVRMGTFLQVHDDYFQWSQQTRINNNKDLQSHAHSRERKAKRRLDIEVYMCMFPFFE